MRNIWRGATLAVVLLTGMPALADTNPDPWEGFNRRVFHFNDRLDRNVVKPAATFYRRVTPQFVMDGIGNFFDNLGEPVTIFNQLLEGKVHNAVSDAGRFVINSTVGVLGLIDVAKHAALPQHHKDFGETLAVWGVGSGPFLMLPLLGPSTVRDLGGKGVDWFDNPLVVNMPLTPDLLLRGADSFNQRAALIPMEGIIQGDKYLFIRDLYLQHRQFEINDGRVQSDPFLDDSDAGSDATAVSTADAGTSSSVMPAAAAPAGATGAASPAVLPAATATSGTP